MAGRKAFDTSSPVPVIVRHPLPAVPTSPGRLWAAELTSTNISVMIMTELEGHTGLNWKGIQEHMFMDV
jgi:hypothetical protein